MSEELLIAIIGSSALASMVSAIANIIVSAIQTHKAKKAGDSKAAIEKAIQNELAPVKTGLCSLLHEKIETDAEVYVNRGYVTFDEREQFAEAWQTYHNLGGVNLVAQKEAVAQLEVRSR